MELILKVQKSFQKYRLEFTKEDSIELIKERGLEILLHLDHKLQCNVKTTCGPMNNKGFDLSNSIIDAWIVENEFHKYPKGKPTKLVFIVNTIVSPLTLKYKSVLFL